MTETDFERALENAEVVKSFYTGQYIFRLSGHRIVMRNGRVIRAKDMPLTVRTMWRHFTLEQRQKLRHRAIVLLTVARLKGE